MPSTPPPETAAPESTSTPAEPQERRFDEPPWRVWTAPAAVVLGLTLGIFATIIIGVIAQAGGSSLSHPSPAVSLSGDLLFDLAFVAAAVYFARLEGRPNPANFGFRLVRLRV